MYKLQKVTDDNWYDVDSIFMQVKNIKVELF